VSTSSWRPAPRRLARLVAGLWLFGAGEAFVVHAGLGNSPWTTFAQGLERQTPLSIGEATIAISCGVLLCWTALRVRPGLGTLLNAVLIGVAIDATLALLGGRAPLAARIAEVPLGIALVGLGSGLYLNAALGPGPRDGLMTGLHARTGRPVAAVRACIELTALACGFALGGTVGPGTVAFALLIGPAVALALRALPGAPSGSRTTPTYRADPAPRAAAVPSPASAPSSRPPSP
jgi:uncharacterized membrane protein YczE